MVTDALVLVLALVLQGGERTALALPDAAPLGLPQPIPAPPDNPLRADVFSLGKRLFFDPILSADSKIACASCHDPERGFASSDPRPLGVFGRRALRHAPTLFNRAYGKSQRWDGKTRTLEEQVLLPIQDPNEMSLSLDDAVARLRRSKPFDREFRAAFGEPPSRVGLSRALACFVRGIVLGDSAVDRFQAGARDALGPLERRGLWIYESKGGCWKCHSGPNLTDEGFHNTGIGSKGDDIPAGRFAVTGRDEDRGRFKTPTLRGLTQTAPYMHDGSLATLEAVVAFYRRGGNRNPNLDAKLAPLALTDEEARALVAFLRALSRRRKSG